MSPSQLVNVVSDLPGVSSFTNDRPRNSCCDNWGCDMTTTSTGTPTVYPTKKTGVQRSDFSLSDSRQTEWKKKEKYSTTEKL